MSPGAARVLFAAALSLALSLIIATAFHAGQMLCDGDWAGSHSRGEALRLGLADLLARPLHLIVVAVPLWLGWTGLLLAAANRAIPPVLGMGIVVFSIFGTVLFYAFAAPNLDCAAYTDRAMSWRAGGLFAFVALLLLLPRLWRPS
ncbi:hypothetical protein [Thioclava nitratireducens]|uniref:hypothetical protein n=1 Tax=Thioclava nitratireducens TaxID=1915078 RepID=UPI0024809EE8|nr:hypothetical protein [Thioclava nitratireducens]WGT50091.1 hypothetical protein P0N61_17575 [Thioclava nitratireducens]